MVSGFKNATDFAPILGWELYQVTLDKYHVMFLFEGGQQLLNIAYRFSHHSCDDSVSYTYETDYALGDGGKRDTNHLDRLLRQRIIQISVISERELGIAFGNDDILVVHDHPRFRSWWFQPLDDSAVTLTEKWAKSDDFGEED